MTKTYEDIVVCLPGETTEYVTERMEHIMRRGNGVSLLVHIGTNNTMLIRKELQ